MRLTTLFLFLFSGLVIADDKLVFIDAWVKQAPPSAKILAAYGQLKNNSKQDIRLISISSDSFKKVEMHMTTLHDGMMNMKQTQQLTLGSNESVIFRPNGRHLMLIKPKRPIKKGDMVPIVMKTNSGEVFLFSVPVKR